MSYAEQHIFLSERTLTAEQRKYADGLSSHAVVGPNSAIYTYVYGGSFSGPETKLLNGTFDAMLWQDSGESFRLRFRLPNNVVPPEELRPYLTTTKYPAVEIGMEQVGENNILSIHCYIEDGERIWIEDNLEPLQELIPLRADLMAGDYRSLYLLARYNQSVEQESNENIENEDSAILPAPPGLGELPNYVNHLCYRCHFNAEDVLTEDDKTEAFETTNYDHNLHFLDKDDMMGYLSGILNNEPDLPAKLRRQLSSFDQA